MKLSILFLFSFLMIAGCDTSPAGKQAPDFQLPLATGESSVTLSQLTQDNPVLLVFWASWCPSCVEEIPTLNEWHQIYSAKGLKILGINVAETREQINAFTQENPIEYPVAMDHDGEVAERFGVYGLPSALFLAKGGEIIYYGFSLPANLEQMLN